jgi:hypothetical protein
MGPTIELTDQQYADLELQIDNIVANNNKSENELYSVIGKSIHYSNDVGMAPVGAKSLFAKTGTDKSWLTTANAINLLSETPSISKEAAVESGKSFWERLKGKIKNEICTNSTIKDFFTGDATLAKALRVIVPIILTAIGITVINPMLMAALVACISLLIKAGYTAYCEIPA